MRRLLIIGCGDVGLRLAGLLAPKYRPRALSSSPARFPLLRAHGVVPVAGNLDELRSLRRLGGLAADVVHLAPPPGAGDHDTRTRHLLAALARRRMLPHRLVYISTTGVYGDCGGAQVDESRGLHPESDRARRRADAERRVRAWGARLGVRVSILRVPGIYAADRLPLARLRAGTAALRPEDDAWTNHVHADDLARIVAAALVRGRAGRTYNACDDSDLKMGEYFDAVADAFGLPRPPRVSRGEAQGAISPAMLSFMRESRRIGNRRMKRELRIALRYPTVRDGIAAALTARGGTGPL